MDVQTICFFIIGLIHLCNSSEPTRCFNNASDAENATALFRFVCLEVDESNTSLSCCGNSTFKICCSIDEYNKVNRVKDKQEQIVHDIDLVTGISVAAAFVVSLTFCLFLYCCCCQSRPEIENGFKLMWFRRSLGKEMNRLEQQNTREQVAVVNSVTGIRETPRRSSRNPSRQGSLKSHQGSLKGNRNPSTNPTPSISRRTSDAPHAHGREYSATQEDRNHLTLDVPSSVLITVTTPSDEHGPTSPLLKTSHHEVLEKD